MPKKLSILSTALKFIPLFYIISTLSACQTADKGTLDYSQLRFDTSSIAIFKWDTTKNDFPKNSEPLPLKQEDMAVIDSVVQEAVLGYNQKYEPTTGSEGKYDPKELEGYKLHLNKYQRQYIPYKDVNGQPIVLIRFFCARDCYCGEFKEWKERLGSGKIYEGTCVFRLKVDLSRREYSDLLVGGYG